MQVAMTVAATKIQILQESNLSQTEKTSPVPENTHPPKDGDPACIT